MNQPAQPLSVHPCNCDTCEIPHHQEKHVRYKHDYPAFVCNGNRLTSETPLVIRWRGCASHSSLRSRPHPAPQVPDDRGWEQGFQDGQASALVDLNIIAEQARREERERLLEPMEDLRKFANGEYNEADASDNEREMRIHLEYENRIWDIMKSLREGAKPR